MADLIGTNGANAIAGSAVADTISGLDGPDIIDGGDGADRLFADLTEDTFVFGGLSGAGDRLFGTK